MKIYNLRKFVYFFIILSVFTFSGNIFAENSYEKKARKQYNDGVTFQKKGKIKKAISKYEKAKRIDPSLYEPYYQLGKIYVNEKNYDKAEIMFKMVTELKPNFYHGHLELGQLYFETKQYNYAKIALEKVLELESNNFDAYYFLGNIYLETGNLKCAKGSFQKAVSICSDNMEVRQLLEQLNIKTSSSINSHPNNLSDSDSLRLLTQETTPTPTAIIKKTQIILSTSKEKIKKYLSLIISVVIFIVFVIAIYLFFICYFINRSVARKDFKLSRGTQHLKQIRLSLQILNKKMQAFSIKLNNLEGNIDKLEEELSEKLYRALSVYLIKTQFCEIEGIGSKLKNAIINEYTNCTIDSLYLAYERINGIGEQKQWVISDWVNTIKKQLTTLSKQDFPNKEKITKEYKTRISNLKNQYNEIKDRLSLLNNVKKMAFSEEKRLSKISVSHFIKAYKNNKEASLLVNEHIKGVFPEWSPMPDWFKTLISESVV